MKEKRYIEIKEGNNRLTFNSNTGRITLKVTGEYSSEDMVKIAEYIRDNAPDFEHTIRGTIKQASGKYHGILQSEGKNCVFHIKHEEIFKD